MSYLHKHVHGKEELTLQTQQLLVRCLGKPTLVNVFIASQQAISSEHHHEHCKLTS